MIPLVVTKTDTDLDMDVGYGLVKKLKMLEKSIFVFTKADMLVNTVKYYISSLDVHFERWLITIIWWIIMIKY